MILFALKTGAKTITYLSTQEKVSVWWFVPENVDLYLSILC